jgi:hypothetical protein
MPSLHDKTIIIDGLIVSNFGPEIFRAMRAGGITAANCTCSIWEDFPTSMRAIAFGSVVPRVDCNPFSRGNSRRRSGRINQARG